MLIEYVKDNATWIFSGIGLTIISVIAFIIKKIIFKEKSEKNNDKIYINQKQKNINKSNNVQIKQEQKGSFGTNNTQIATQNIYNGISNEEAIEVIIKKSTQLFYDNFPKLRKEALATVERNFNEFINTLISKLENVNFTNFNVFSEPDMQYILLEAMKGYSRRGDKELLDMLSELIIHRCKEENQSTLQLALNEAIIVSTKLSPVHFNILSILYILGLLNVNETGNEIETFDDLKEFLIINFMPFINNVDIQYSDINYLECVGAVTNKNNRSDLGVLLARKYPELIVISNLYTEHFSLSKIITRDNEAFVVNEINGRKEEMQLKEYLQLKMPELSKLFYIFNDVGMKSVDVNYVGSIIGQINFENVLESNINL